MKKPHAEHRGREQLGWKFGIGKEKMQLKFGKVKNKKNKKLLCILTWTQKGYFEQLFEKYVILNIMFQRKAILTHYSGFPVLD